jgi:hypothetical protein
VLVTSLPPFPGFPWRKDIRPLSTVRPSVRMVIGSPRPARKAP